MIPAVFKMLVQVLKEEHITPDYLRIPVESMAPYFKTPSLYFTYSVANIIKQCLLSMLWIIDKKNVKEYHMSKVYFFGLLLSGKMDERRVHKILPHYIKKAQKEGRDLEVLFHPGYLNATELESENKNIQFPSFYLSENRKKEFDCVMRLAKRSVQECHILNRIK